VFLSRSFLGLETKTETLAIRSRDRHRDLDKMNSSLETMVSRSHHWLHQFQLVTEHLLKGATNYSNRATGVGTKHAALKPRPRPGSSGLETLDFWSRDLGHQVSRPRPGQNELEFRDHGLEITSLLKFKHIPRPFSVNSKTFSTKSIFNNFPGP